MPFPDRTGATVSRSDQLASRTNGTVVKKRPQVNCRFKMRKKEGREVKIDAV